MSLVVETGAGLANAESFISVVDATVYHAGRGNAAWAAVASDTIREQLLRRATDYLEETYRTRWAGTRVTATQALSWPRSYVPMPDAPGGYRSYAAYYAINVVPAEVAKACAEMALRAIAGDLAADLEAPVIEETVGPITTKYAAGARQAVRYPAVEGLLQPLLGAGGMTRVVRA